MFRAPYLCLLYLLAASVIIQEIRGIDYEIMNQAGGTPGGITFERKLRKGAVQTMDLATRYIWKLLGQSHSSDDRVKVVKIYLVIAVMDEDSKYELRYQIGRIFISSNYIAKGKSTKEVGSNFINIVYYEMTHILQWDANGRIPKAIKDGIAAFILLDSGSGNQLGWVELGGGETWDEDPGATGRFFQFVANHLCRNFVPRYNAMMKDSYNDTYFEELTGMSIPDAWRRYKAKYT